MNFSKKQYGLIVFSFFFIILSFHLTYQYLIPKQAGHNPLPLMKIEQESPDLVLLGNSMVHVRMNLSLFVQSMGPLKTLSLSVDTTTPDYWYLALKNYVLKASRPPKYVALFFRDQDLLVRTPFHELHPLGQKAISGALFPGENYEDVYAGGEGVERPGPGQKLIHFMDQHLLFPQFEDVLKNSLSEKAAELLGVQEKMHFKTALKNYFSAAHLRPSLVPQITAPESQSLSLETSYVPRMIKLAKSKGVTLIFVNIMRQPRADGELNLSEKTIADMHALETYFKEQGMLSINLSEEKKFGHEAFVNDYYMAPAYVDPYTSFVSAKIRQEVL